MRLLFSVSAFVLVACCQLSSFAQSNQNTLAPIQQQNATPVQASQATNNAPNQAPKWHSTLSADHLQFLNQLLDHWTAKSADVKKYKCDFVRYDYDTTFCNWRDPNTNRLAAASIMTGEIRFAAPDRASYETQQVFDFEAPPKQAGQNASYKPRKESTQREKWICDGKAIYEFDYQNKKLYETEIPVSMRGKGLINSPLPFLFGASKSDILERFWVRIITPEGAENEYWLEAYPKKIDDARNYQKLELVLSRDELFLPIMLHIYAPNYNPAENKLTSRVFEFKNRKVNSNLDELQSFFGLFVRPRKPLGFDWVKRQSLQAHQQFSPEQLNRPAQVPGKNPIR